MTESTIKAFLAAIFASLVLSGQGLVLARSAKCIPVQVEETLALKQMRLAMSPELLSKKLIYTDLGYACNQLYSVYLANSDGSGQMPLSVEEMSDSYPNWSPDGSRIVFVYSDNAIYSMKPDGTDRVEVVTFDPQPVTFLYSPTYSPDGKQITFTGHIGASEIKTFIVDTDGANLFELPVATELSEYVLSWSPDSRQVVYTQKTKQGVFEIYIAQRNGSNRSKLADGYQADWSPDGKQIVFAYNKWVDSHLYSAIMAISPDGSGLKELFVAEPDQYIIAPLWSPTGNYMAFALAQYSIQNPAGNERDIYVINANGSNPRNITASYEDAEGKAWGSEVSWSFDEQFIAYSFSKGQWPLISNLIGITELTTGKSAAILTNAISPKWQP